MKKKLTFICIFALLSSPFLFAQQYRIKYSTDAKDPMSLENAIRLALENNYELLLTEQDVVIAEQRLKESKMLYLPQISVNAGATAYNLDSPTVLPESFGLRFLEENNDHKNSELFYGVGVLATQYLYTGGRTSSTVSMANAGLKEAMSRYEAVKSSVIYNVKEAFFNYLFLQQKLALIKDAYKRTDAIISKAQLKQWERVMVKAEQSTLKSEINSVNRDLEAARLKLVQTLNKEADSKIFITGDFDYIPVNVDLAKATLWAMEFRPELKSALYKLEMDNIAVKLSLARRYPDIMLGASYDRQGYDDLDDENFQLTLALKLPIGYNYGTQLRQKRAEQRQTVLKRAAIEDTIRLEVTNAFNKLTFWQQEAPARIETWDAINKELNRLDTSTMAKEDIFKTFDYFYKAGVGYLEAIKQHMLAVADLELAVGQDIRE
ncbi:MAG: TolC family protein [Elusimicrobiota bacterium]|jgi:outer membrane protein TolC|nr:TolC family protein [Elusimicrobiota bacterium]